MDHAQYMSYLFDPQTLRIAGEELTRALKPFTTIRYIAVSGVSGNAIGGLVSALSGLPMAIVRKGESSHSFREVEGSDDIDECEPYAVIDDLVSSGATVARIAKYLGHLPRVVLVYQSGSAESQYVQQATIYDTSSRWNHHRLEIRCVTKYIQKRIEEEL